MRVYFVGGSYMGCWYVRCFLPMSKNGWTGNYTGLTQSSIKDHRLATKEMQNSDVIVFHRPNTNWHHRVAIELKKLGKKVVFDNDDTFKLDSYHPFAKLDEKGFKENKRRVNNVINNFARNADLVTCSTEFLAKEYKETNPNTIVLPNCVDPDDWDEPLKNESDKVRIGLVGSVAYHHDFAEIKDIIRNLSKDKNIQIVLFGLTKKSPKNPKIAKVYKKEFEFWESINIEFAPWVDMIDYFDKLNELRLDMMLIPRRNNHFNKAKSNVKFLEASMLEIPVIASKFSDAPYNNDINGENGMLVENDWINAIYSLVNDKQKKRQMGKKAREYVLKNYNIADHAYKWEEAYKTLW